MNLESLLQREDLGEGFLGSQHKAARSQHSAANSQHKAAEPRHNARWRHHAVADAIIPLCRQVPAVDAP